MNDNLYREELMEVYKNSKNRGSITNPSTHAYKKNPMCGDEIDLQLSIENGVIKDAKFNGSACAVSVISSNFLTDFVVGRKLDEVKNITKDDLLKMIGINLTTSRVKCATLVLEALESAVENYEKESK